MPSEISVGVMGLGIMGTGHLDNLVKMPDVSVTALWDINPARASDFAGQVGEGIAAPFEDYHDLIEHAGVDALFIAIPPHTHTDHEILAARRGIPFLLEKAGPPILDTSARNRASNRRNRRSSRGRVSQPLPAAGKCRSRRDWVHDGGLGDGFRLLVTA